MKTAVTETASAAATEFSTPNSMEEALETGFLPDDPHYRLTGEFKEDEKPETKTKTAETQPEKDAASAAASEAETAAASAAAETQKEEKKGQQKTSATSESRWAKITRENRELREKLARAAAPASDQPQRDPQQASQPATEAATSTRPKIDDVDPKTGKPKYATYAEYEAAKDEWLSGETIRKFQETSAKTDREKQLAQAEQVLAQGFAKKLETSRTTHADFDTVALNPDLVIPRGSVTDGFLLDSDHAGEVLYYLGQHPEILQGFYGQHDPKTGKFVNKVTPYAQARELTKIELKIAGESSSQSQEKSSSARQVTQAPRPPHQVSGKGTVAKEAVEQAVEDNDFETYSREQNARELARRRRK